MSAKSGAIERLRMGIEHITNEPDSALAVGQATQARPMTAIKSPLV